MNNNEKKQKLALFKFGIIAPVLNDTVNKQNQYFRTLSKKTLDVPVIGTKRFHTSTFKSWLAKYRKHGFKGLYKINRIDKGKSKKITAHISDGIKKIIEDYNVPSYAELYRKLIQLGYFDKDYIKYQTITKYMHKNNIKLKPETLKPRKKFEMDFVNQMWVSDFVHGPYLQCGKKKKKAILCSIIDDRSRVIVGYNWSFHENVLSLQIALKKALLTYGLCQKFYCDNGAAFVSSHLALVCAKLGISLIHSEPYDSPSRGKSERFNRTVRQMFLPSLDSLNITIDEINSLFEYWLKNSYHKAVHKGINMPPMDRFLTEIKNINVKRFSEDELEHHFLVTAKRKVKNDSTISFNGILYEVPSKFISSYIEIRYPLYNENNIFIYQNDKPVLKLKKVDIHENSRNFKSSISFSNM